MLHKVEKNLKRHTFVSLCIWKSCHIYLLYLQLTHTFLFFKQKTSMRYFVPFPSSTDNPDFWIWKEAFLLLSNILLCSKFKYVIWNRLLKQENYWIIKYHNSTHNLLFSFLRRRKIFFKVARETFLFKITASSYNIYSNAFIANGLNYLCGSPLPIITEHLKSRSSLRF